MKKKILIFSLVYFPRHIGGAEIAIKEITDRLGDYFIFDMITLRIDKKLPVFEKIGNVNVYRVGWVGNQKTSSDSLPFYLHLNKYFYFIFGTFKALVLNREKKYDAIWSMMASYNSFSALLFKLLNSKIPFILSLQEGDPFDYIKKRAGLFWPIFKKIFIKADIIQAISNYLADWAREMSKESNIVVIPNGVDLGKFKNQNFIKISQSETKFNPPAGGQNSKVGELRREWGFGEDDVVLITASRLVDKNAVGDIIESLKYLSENIKLVIAGVGYLEESLKLQVLSSELQTRVKFVGQISHKDLPSCLQASDIFIRPSLSEGFGNSFIEAMAVGIPVIATPVGGIVDFLKDGETGLFCEVKNPKSIAKKVEKLMKDKESREYIVANAFKMVSLKYDWNLIARDMKEKVFNVILKNGK